MSHTNCGQDLMALVLERSKDLIFSKVQKHKIMLKVVFTCITELLITESLNIKVSFVFYSSFNRLSLTRLLLLSIISVSRLFAPTKCFRTTCPTVKSTPISYSTLLRKICNFLRLNKLRKKCK